MRRATKFSLKALKHAEQKNIGKIKESIEAGLFTRMENRLNNTKKNLAEAYFIDDENLYDEMWLMAKNNYGTLFNKEDAEGIVRKVVEDVRKLGRESMEEEIQALLPKLRKELKADFKRVKRES